MSRFAISLLVAVLFIAGCGPGGVQSSPTSTPAVSPLSRFAVPAKIAFTVPPPPPVGVPARPTGLRRITPAADQAHPAFFAGEVPLGNGVYYLALPNGNPFGYYSYLSNQNYIYHFDMGYEYTFDANDGNGGIYFYDFTSQHFWYTSRVFPFPYLYDFSLNSVVYYYPDPNNAGHYTTNPRYFYNFATGQIITM